MTSVARSASALLNSVGVPGRRWRAVSSTCPLSQSATSFGTLEMSRRAKPGSQKSEYKGSLGRWPTEPYLLGPAQQANNRPASSYERHLRIMARDWAIHYNQGRPHKSLAPGIPDPPPGLPAKRHIHTHEVPEGFSIKERSILKGLQPQENAITPQQQSSKLALHLDVLRPNLSRGSSPPNSRSQGRYAD